MGRIIRISQRHGCNIETHFRRRPQGLPFPLRLPRWSEENAFMISIDEAAVLATVNKRQDAGTTQRDTVWCQL